MPRIDKPMKAKKVVKKSKPVKRTKKSVVKVSKPTVLKSKPIKDPVAYFGCMSACCQKGIKPKKITEIAHECKTNALVTKKKMSAEKLKDIKKLGSAFNEFKKVLTEHVKKY